MNLPFNGESASPYTPQKQPVHALRGMAYQAEEISRQWAHAMATTAQFAFSNPFNPFAETMPMRVTRGYMEFLEHLYAPHRKHEFDFSIMDAERKTDLAEELGRPAAEIAPRTINGEPVDVNIEIVDELPFGRLKHFSILDSEGETHGTPRPPLLIVAPMSGHFDTLLTGTVYRLMHDYDVYITDWTDVKDVPLEAGKFDLNDYISYLKDQWLPLINARHQPENARTTRPTVHTLAVCQPGVPLLAAVSMMAEDGSPDVPLSMTLMGSPIDTRLSPTKVNQTATERPLSWFEENAISEVPLGHPGAGRMYYSGFGQLFGFMMMNADSHSHAYQEMATGMTFGPWNEAVEKMNFDQLTIGNRETALRRKDFYKEYRTVMDISAPYYIQTIKVAFQEHHLARGIFEYEDPFTGNKRTVDPSYIDRTGLMTIEGEKDDITGAGQTFAAHDLADNIPASMRRRRTQQGVGHYGLFNGKSWRREIAPDMIAFTNGIDRINGLNYEMREETVRSLKTAGLWHDERAPAIGLEQA
ncbi:MAG: polyhydroxyalkanoate depolymerase [Alphaproteobacteria bacterium]|nr:polyhydroxyalkanoate depolymerase [Alphaproteobacteria bacterium]